MTFNQLIAFINLQIKTNGNREITAAVLNPVLQAMSNWAKDTTGDLDNLNTSDHSNLVAAINEVNQALASVNDNSINVYYGLEDPNFFPPPSFTDGDFYVQVDALEQRIGLWIYDGISWKNLTTILNNGGVTTLKSYNNNQNLIGTTVTVPMGFDGTIFNRDIPQNVVTFTQSGTTLTITSGATDGDFLWITGLQPNI